MYHGYAAFIQLLMLMQISLSGHGILGLAIQGGGAAVALLFPSTGKACTAWSISPYTLPFSNNKRCKSKA
jgi:hypothetical protein